MCACTEPVRTGFGAVCVEYGRPKWPITMLNHTHTWITQTHTHHWYRIMFGFFIFGTLCSYDPLWRGFWHPMLVRPVMKGLFCPWKTKGKKDRFARAPHYYMIWSTGICNSQTPYFNWNIAQARPMNVSDVSRSLQSWVSTTHRLNSQLTFFYLRKYVSKNVLAFRIKNYQ